MRAQPNSCYTVNVETAARVQHGIKGQGIFYGWYIVGVGFLANVASSFALASTLSIFLKPLTAELGISRGVFSLLRSGEGIIGACLAPLVGTLVDRYGGRWLMAIGAAIVGVGYFFLGHIEGFGQFAAIRLTLVTFGDALMGSMVATSSLSNGLCDGAGVHWRCPVWASASPRSACRSWSHGSSCHWAGAKPGSCSAF